jgi:2-oxoglutarate ferredoxin oxidoreductase subunit alpha
MPGQAGLNHVAGSDEHDEGGHLISDVKSGIPEWVDARTRMMDKRMRKLNGLARDSPPPVLEGPSVADLTIVSWGSTIGPVRDAMAILARRNRPTNLIHVRTVYPLHRETIAQMLGAARTLLLVEENFSGQLGRLIRAETGVAIPHHLFKYDGEPFYPNEIAVRATEIVEHARG